MTQSADLQEQIVRAIQPVVGLMDVYPAADAVVELIAERERLLRERIEALTIPLFEQGSSARLVLLDDVLGVFDDEY